MLCRGNHFTEAEAKVSLQQFASTYHDQTSWEKRADRIRKGIRDGNEFKDNLEGKAHNFKRKENNPNKW